MCLSGVLIRQPRTAGVVVLLESIDILSPRHLSVDQGKRNALKINAFPSFSLQSSVSLLLKHCFYIMLKHNRGAHTNLCSKQNLS